MFRFLKRLTAKLRQRWKPRKKAKKKSSPKPRRRHTFDARTKKNLDTLHPKVKDTFIALTEIAISVGKKYGVTVKMISGHRSMEEQKKLYAKGRYGNPGPIVTTVKVSRHCFQIAADYGCFSEKGSYLDATNPTLTAKIYTEIYKEAKKEGLRIIHGGTWKSFPDHPHFEYKNNLTISQMKEIVRKGEQVV
jgi:peptidoglycan L-alanyl-D-glutamate endopeptidase CwlK